MLTAPFRNKGKVAARLFILPLFFEIDSAAIASKFAPPGTPPPAKETGFEPPRIRSSEALS